MTGRDDDTPSKPLTALDEKLEKYLGDEADCPSTPPPPWLHRRRDALVEKMRPLSQSGTWDMERLLADNQAFYERALERAIAGERLAHMRERAEAAETALQHGKERRERIVDHVVKAVAAAAVLGFLARVAWLLLAR